jgi:hypothetical protein
VKSWRKAGFSWPQPRRARVSIETETSITGKLARGAFATSFFLATLAALDMEGVRLEDL